MSEQSQSPILLTRKTAAALLSLSERSLDYLIQRGDLKARRVGRKVLVPRSELERFANRDHKSLRA
jgi:excisionase family DNA binding protein